MSWAQIDDKILDCPKALDAGEEATDLFIRGLIWCSCHLTDGRIPKAGLSRLSGKPHREQLAAELVRVGWWEDHGTHWQVHDYLAHNKSREQVEAERAKAKARQDRYRERKQKELETATQRSTAPSHDASVTRDKRVTNAVNDGAHSTPLLSTADPDGSVPPPSPSAAAEGGSSATRKRVPSRGGRKAPASSGTSEVGARVLARINALAGTAYEHSPELEARIREGVPEADLLAVVEDKARDAWWRTELRLRPSALFRPLKFREHLGAARAAPAPLPLRRPVGGLAPEPPPPPEPPPRIGEERVRRCDACGAIGVIGTWDGTTWRLAPHAADLAGLEPCAAASPIDQPIGGEEARAIA